MNELELDGGRQPSRMPRYAVRYIALLVTAGFFVSLYGVKHDADQRAEDSRNTAIAICLGQNVVRDVLSDKFVAERKQAASVSFAKAFPNLSRQTIHHLRHNQLSTLTRAIHRLRPKPCHNL